MGKQPTTPQQTWSQAAPGSRMTGGIPQMNTPVLGAGGLPTITDQMRQQALYIPPVPRNDLAGLLARQMFGPYTNESGLLGYNYRGGANRSGGGYTTSGGGYSSSAGYGGGMGGRVR